MKDKGNKMLRPRVILIIAAAAGLQVGTALAQDLGGDPTAGEQVYKKCMVCHRIGPGAKNAVGPTQNGLIGRTAGTADGFSYSSLNKHAGENGLAWTEQNIYDYLPDPNAFLKKFLTDKGKADLATGSTKMSFKLASEKERKDVIAYIKKAGAAQ
jgi:cytochrome c